MTLNITQQVGKREHNILLNRVQTVIKIFSSNWNLSRGRLHNDSFKSNFIREIIVKILGGFLKEVWGQGSISPLVPVTKTFSGKRFSQMNRHPVIFFNSDDNHQELISLTFCETNKWSHRLRLDKIAAKIDYQVLICEW